MTSWCSTGMEFTESEPAVVRDFLTQRGLKRIAVPPDRLHVTEHGARLYLQIVNGTVREYPLRESFLFKLLRWYGFPLGQLPRLSIETVVSVLNDFLLQIRSGDVTVTIENGDALTITSARYARVDDLDVLGLGRLIAVTRVTRNDFFMRMYSECTFHVEPVPGDTCGVGANIINSETGFRALSLEHYLLRFSCSNGAIVRTGDSHRWLHTDATGAQLLQRFRAALMVHRDERALLLDRLRAARKPLTISMRKRAQHRMNALMGQVGTRQLMQQLPAESTVYDLFNLVTSAAKQFDTRRQMELQYMAGDLLPNLDRADTAHVA